MLTATWRKIPLSLTQAKAKTAQACVNEARRLELCIMRTAVYAATAASTFTFIPALLLTLNSETGFVGVLKSVAAALGIPGAFVGLLFASGRIHDVDVWVVNGGNFGFYFALVWLTLKFVGRARVSKTEPRARLNP